MTQKKAKVTRKAKAYVAPEMENAIIDSEVYAESEQIIEKKKSAKKGKTDKIEDKIVDDVTAAKISTVKKVGVIGTIASLLIQSGEKGISKKEILDQLLKKFPDRLEVHMKATVAVQVPSRINKERFALKKLEGGLYACAEPVENDDEESDL